MKFLFTDPTLLTATVPVKVTRALDGTLRAFTEEHGRRVGIMLRDAVVKGIKNQRFNHVPLSPKYKKWKQEHNLDTRPLIAIGDYTRSVQVRQVKTDPEGNVTVVVGPRIGMHYSGFSYGKIARIHEFGVSDKFAWFKKFVNAVTHSGVMRPRRPIPARPHWRPVFNAFSSASKQHANALAKDLLAALKESLRPYVEKTSSRSSMPPASW